jgi:hypothetical protein
MVAPESSSPRPCRTPSHPSQNPDYRLFAGLFRHASLRHRPCPLAGDSPEIPREAHVTRTLGAAIGALIFILLMSTIATRMTHFAPAGSAQTQTAFSRP